MTRSTTRARTLTVAWLAALALQPAYAVDWDPQFHHKKGKRLVAPRAEHRVPRDLSKRQNTIQPGQPTHRPPNRRIGGFEVIGESGVSGQMLFLGTDTLVYIIDKVEHNPAEVNGHPAWATEYDLITNEFRPMDVVTNTFCAGGALLGDGQWLNVGGNQAVEPNGIATADARDQSGNNTFQNAAGGFSTRTLFPGEGAEWIDDPADDLTTRRWYPTLETLENGGAIIIGGNQYGGFVNDENNNNPTYEFWPKENDQDPIAMPLLERTLPANLYPITNLIPFDHPSRKLLINLNQNAVIFDYELDQEYDLPPVPHAVRTYPASAATVMLPMTVENGWVASVLYCGGSDITPDVWLSGQALINVAASDSCVRMTPQLSAEWEEDDSLPEGRVMGNAILLPDGTVFVVNGANTGVAGYGNDSWALDWSYANSPLQSPLLYDPSKPAGSRWTRDGFQESDVPRMYHSTATLLPDGSVFVTGSNPHPDYAPDATFPTEYRVERFYPKYYNNRRPEPFGIPESLTYGGQYFELELTSEDLFDNIGNANTVKVVLVKTGFSTHGINFGQRMAELDHSFTRHPDGGVTLHVSQAPPNPAIIPPGPAWLFVVVNGTPSVGVSVMVGSGVIEEQEILDVEPLPQSSVVNEDPDVAPNDSGAISLRRPEFVGVVALALAAWLL